MRTLFRSHTIVDFNSHCEHLSLHGDSHEWIFTRLLIRALADSVRNDDWSATIPSPLDSKGGL